MMETTGKKEMAAIETTSFGPGVSSVKIIPEIKKEITVPTVKIETTVPTKDADVSVSTEDALKDDDKSFRPFDGPPPEEHIPAVKKYLATGVYPAVVTKDEKRAIRRRARDCVLEVYTLYYEPKSKEGEILKERLLLCDKDEDYEILSAEEKLKRVEMHNLNQGGPKEPKDKDAELFHCEVCNVDVSGAMNYTAHLQGKKHCKKLNPKGPATAKGVYTNWPKTTQEWIKLYKSQHIKAQPAETPQGSLSATMAPILPNAQGNKNKGFEMFVGGLPYTTDEKQLRKYFERWGKVLDARVVTDKETGKSRGFGFVAYTTREEIHKCLAAGPHDIDGRPIQPREAEDGPRSSSNPEDISGGTERKSKFMRLMGVNKGSVQKIPTVTPPFGFVYGATESDFQQIPQDYGVAQYAQMTNQDFNLAPQVQQPTQAFGTQQVQPIAQGFGAAQIQPSSQSLPYPSAPAIGGGQFQQATQVASQFQTSTAQFQQPNPAAFGSGQVQQPAQQFQAAQFPASNQGYGAPQQFQAPNPNQGFEAAQFQMQNQGFAAQFQQAPQPPSQGLAVQPTSQGFASQPPNPGFAAQPTHQGFAAPPAPPNPAVAAQPSYPAFGAQAPNNAFGAPQFQAATQNNGTPQFPVNTANSFYRDRSPLR